MILIIKILIAGYKKTFDNKTSKMNLLEQFKKK